uniref:Uncharacterized protein n=1 Tax=Sphaerodactylus townsendi TaxID=933632 RepID=A0ACB8F7N2_9SAUR
MQDTGYAGRQLPSHPGSLLPRSSQTLKVLLQTLLELTGNSTGSRGCALNQVFSHLARVYLEFFFQMSNASPPAENQQQPPEEEEEEVVTEAIQDPQLPDEGNVPPTVAPVASEGEPGLGPHAHCQAWLLDRLDDVCYLISCTNWY